MKEIEISKEVTNQSFIINSKTIDTLALSKILRNAGTSRGEAETQAEVISTVFNVVKENKEALSKKDLEAEIAKTNLQIQQVRSDLTIEIEKNRSEIQQVRSDLTVEIEKNRSEIQQVRSDLTVEIEKNGSEIKQVRSDLTVEIQQIRSDLTMEIANSKVEIIKWVVGLMMAQTGLLFALIKFFA